MFCLLALAPTALPASPRPNILFLFSDDQRTDQRTDPIASLGNRLIKTPSLDLLVRSGTSFTRACCLTGRLQLVSHPKFQKLQLFDLRQGPFALVNAPQHAAHVDSLKTKLTALPQAGGAPSR